MTAVTAAAVTKLGPSRAAALKDQQLPNESHSDFCRPSLMGTDPDVGVFNSEHEFLCSLKCTSTTEYSCPRTLGTPAANESNKDLSNDAGTPLVRTCISFPPASQGLGAVILANRQGLVACYASLLYKYYTSLLYVYNKLV